MTVAELKKLLEGVDDNTPLLAPSFDHCFRMVDAKLMVVIAGQGYHSELWGLEYVQKDEKAIHALVIG